MEMQDIFGSYENTYLMFEDIPKEKRLHQSRFLCGCLKLASLLKNPTSLYISGAEHDIVYLCPEKDIRDDITAEDIIYLRRCGFHFDTDFGGVAYFC